MDKRAGTPVLNVNLDAVVTEQDLARIANLQHQGIPLYCVIGTDQAKMDLKFETINTNTGEVASDGSEQ